MVWVVEGTLNSEKDDPADSVPPASSHYLRPSRTYKVGRMGGVRAPTKPGAKPGPASKHRPFDFRIASLSISKEGMCEFESGGEDWEAEDSLDSPSNGSPYPLTVKVTKRLRLTRADGEQTDMTGDSVQVQDGDHFQDLSKGYWFRLKWIPLFFCFAIATVAQKKEYLAEGKKLGVKIAFKTFLPHHTHFVMKSASPTVHLLRAAVAAAHVVSPSFFGEIVARSHCASEPPEPLPPHPGPAPASGSSKEDLTGHDKLVSAWEKQLLALNDDVGADWGRWWGHAFLEKDWEAAWPQEEEFPPERANQAKDWDPREWKREEKRKDLLKGCLFVSFRGNASVQQDEADSEIVTSAHGTFFASDLLQRDPLPPVSELLTAIVDFKADHPGEGDGDESKVVIFPPIEVFEVAEGDDRVRQQLELLKDLQRSLKVGKLCQGAELAQAVYHVDTAPLFGNDIPPAPGATQEQSGGSSSRRTQSTATATQATQFTDATPPFPTGGVPGTHPESGQTAAGPSGSMDVDGAGGAGSANASQEGESGPSQPRKLKRRAKTRRDVYEDLFDDLDREKAEGESSSRQPLTQDEGGRGTLASSVAGPSSSRMDVEPANGASGPAPTGRATTLKRRAAKKDVFASMFGDDSPEKGGPDDDGSSAQTQSVQEEWRRKGKTKQERMQAIEEEDRRMAEEEAMTKSARGKKGKGRAGEEGEDQGGAAAMRKKRDKSAAIGSSDSEEDRQPARKRTTKKDGVAPVATTSKRTRAQTRSPGASSSEDESARPAARKKSEPPIAAEDPKNKKDAAAQKKAEKEAQEKEKARLLQIKTTKRKGAEVDQAFNEDFNALKIVKPVLKSVPRVEKHRVAWDEDDSDVERHERMVREDQERLAAEEDDEDMDPEHWRRPTQAMFVVKTFDIERKQRPPPRTDIVLDDKWAGKANFKKFRPKNTKGPREPLAQRQQVELVVPDAVDFGLGAGYNDRKGTTFSQVQQADDEDDEDDLLRTMTNDQGQVKLSFGPAKGKKKAPARKPAASKAKGKGKAKQQVVSDSEEDQLASDDDHRSSNTLRADDMDLDDEDGSPPAASKKKTTGRAPRKAAQAATIIIDEDDSDSDSGLTFKGFGKKGAGSSSARVRR